jgi:hypothetical protein
VCSQTQCRGDSQLLTEGVWKTPLAVRVCSIEKRPILSVVIHHHNAGVLVKIFKQVDLQNRPHVVSKIDCCAPTTWLQLDEQLSEQDGRMI